MQISFVYQGDAAHLQYDFEEEETMMMMFAPLAPSNSDFDDSSCCYNFVVVVAERAIGLYNNPDSEIHPITSSRRT